MSEKPTLVLIDGHALAYRAFHALPQEMANPTGELTNAAFGFAAMLLQVLEVHQPEYIAVTFDRGYTAREELFPEYKANRAEMAEALRLQLPRIQEIIDTFGIPIFAADGWEADDVLGTLAQQAARAGVQTLIVTGDTDLFQLVDDNTRVVTSGRRFSDVVIYDEDRVRERYGVPPDALPQWKSLKGDPSDNIPGVPGIGDKTATQLIKAFGTVENTIASADEISARRIRENLLAHAGQARLNVELVTIRRDAPVSLDLDAARFAGYDRQAVSSLFRELDFRSLMGRLPDRAEDTGPAARKASPDGEYVTVDSLEGLERLAGRLDGCTHVCFDVETTSTDPMRARLVGLAVSDMPGHGWYIPIGHYAVEALPGQQGRLGLDAGDGDSNLPLEVVSSALQDVLGGPAVKIAHNAKYDILVLRRHGLDVRGPLFDTMVAAWLVDPGRRAFGLKGLAWSDLGVEMTAITDLIGRGRSQITMAEVSVEAATPYAGADVDMTLRLAESLEAQLDERGVRRLFGELEMPLVSVLADMEQAGILVDPGMLATISDELISRIADLEVEIFKEAGHEFNIGSPQQLGKVLFEELGLPATKRTKTGYSTAATALSDLAPGVPIVQDVLDWRHLKKLKGTYVDALPTLIHPETGRIHTSWGQASVVTGRLSSRDPNLQNIPVRTEVGGQIRRAFVADAGCVFLAADYSQIELRILATLSGDPGLREVFRVGGDVHAATAAFLFDKLPSAVSSNERRIAKMVNFGVLYGMSAFGLARRTGLSRAEASDFIDRYFGQYAAVRGYFDQVLADAAEKGYVETILGRRRYFPQLGAAARLDHAARQRAEREAINAPIQGSAADITKVAMIRLHRALAERGLTSRMLLQVHDELLLEVPERELPEVADLTAETMSHAVQLGVDLVVDLSVGPNWGELEAFGKTG